MTCADLARIINSDQVQSKLRQVRTTSVLHELKKKNPLKNRSLMNKLNPHYAVKRAAEKKVQDEKSAKRAASIKATRKAVKKAKTLRRKGFNTVAEGLQSSFRKADAEWIRTELNAVEESEGEEEDEQ
jgi:large subunit ribosomal protein L4e